MISIHEAQARVLDRLQPTGVEVVPLADALARVLATDITARVTQPPRDVSAMDGYAIIAEDSGTRHVVGSAPAGHPWQGLLGHGQAVRIFTGSFIPTGADTVVIQEDVVREADTLRLNVAVGKGQHIRSAGTDFQSGEVLVPKGVKLTPRQIGLIAAGNYAWVNVYRRPVIAILATGDEISLPGDPVADGGIISSNSHALAAMIRACGGIPLVLPIAIDQPEAIAASAASASHADMLVTTGGASVGEHDLVATALAGQGLELAFWKVAMRPGKPLMHGHIGRLPLLGLPGNPVSAYVCGLLFLKPVIERLSGLAADLPRPSIARLGSDLPANDLRADHLRCTLVQDETGAWSAYPATRQDSSLLRILADCSGLILRAPFAPAASAGSEVEVLRIDLMGL